jgi:hypothetical protein
MPINLFRKKIAGIEYTHTLVYHHLGLGDYIILSGGLKYLRRNNLLGPVFCICRHQYFNSVQQLYSDIADFEIVGVNDAQQADLLVKHWAGRTLFVGFGKLRDWKYFDKDFYRIINVDFKERWDSFTIKRNNETENKLLEKVCPPGEFAFVHDDVARGYKINNKFINSNLAVVRPHVSDSIFDWISVLEKATEIHCICSSFKHLVDSLPQIQADLFYHYSYVNNGNPREDSITQSKKSWKIV